MAAGGVPEIDAASFAPHRLVPFEPRHEVGVISLIEECYSGYDQRIELDTLDADLGQIPELYAPPQHMFHVLVSPDHAVIATIAVKTDGAGSGELKRVFVSPDHRRQGLGKKLTYAAFAWARRQGCTSLEFWSDVLYTKAHKMYAKLGATQSGETRLLGGINEVREYHFRIDL